MAGPEQLEMGAVADFNAPQAELTENAASSEFERELVEALRQRTSLAATAGYVVVASGHAGLLWVHFQNGTDDTLFVRLAAVQVCLCFEAAVYALGDASCWSRCSHSARSRGLALVEFVSRVRLLASAIVWAWLVPWAAELACRCKDEASAEGHTTFSESGGAMALEHARGLAMFVSVYFAFREVLFCLRGEPPSALDKSVKPQFGDCLTSNAVLGGQFRLDKNTLEETGRVLYVPARHRQGLYVASGLATLSHLAGGATLALRSASASAPPWWLLGASGALLSRRLGDRFGGAQGKPSAKEDDAVPTKRSQRCDWDAVRLFGLTGELWWIACCVLELQRCQASSTSWQPSCSA